MPASLTAQVVVELGIIIAMTLLLASRRGRGRLGQMSPVARRAALAAYFLGTVLVLTDILATVLRVQSPRP